MIYKYKLVTDEYTTYRLRLPEDVDGNQLGQEIANINGTVFVSIPDGATLPEQPKQISVTEVTMTAKLLKRLKHHSPQARLIRRRVREAIETEYTVQDEIKLLRRRNLDKAKFSAYQAFVEQCRADGEAERVKLGMGKLA